MNYDDAKPARTEEQEIVAVEVSDLFAEELPEQNDLAAPAGTISSVSSVATTSSLSSAGTISSFG